MTPMASGDFVSGKKRRNQSASHPSSPQTISKPKSALTSEKEAYQTSIETDHNLPAFTHTPIPHSEPPSKHLAEIIDANTTEEKASITHEMESKPGLPSYIDIQPAVRVPTGQSETPTEPVVSERVKHRWRRLVLALGLLFVLLSGIGAIIAWRTLETWAITPFGESGEVTVTIQQGMSARAASGLLYVQGIISNDRAMLIWLKLHGRMNQIQAGIHQLKRPITPVDLLKTLKHGSFERVLTIPEGWSIYKIANRLKQEKWIQDEVAWLDLQLRPEDWFSLFGKDADELALGIEGFCFPETYRLEDGTQPQVILQKMVERFHKEWNLASRQRDPQTQALSMRQIVTMASLIQREARLKEEMPIIASVYYNRLVAGMLLQCDATIHYALGDVWDRALTLEDLKLDSPYNTYKYKGLPVGPICNPGREALKAALNPAKTDYLFYVLSADKKHHSFTKTNAEHEAEKRKAKKAKD